MIGRLIGFLTTWEGVKAVLMLFLIILVGAILFVFTTAFITGKPLRVLGHNVANWSWTLPKLPSWDDGGDGATPTPGSGSTSCSDINDTWLVTWIGPQEGRLDSDWTQNGNQWNWGCPACKVGTFVSASFSGHTTYLLHGIPDGSGGWKEAKTKPGETITANVVSFVCQ